MSAHRTIRVSLPFPIYDEKERAEAIEREQILLWGAMHAGCWGGVCHARSEPHCHSNHQPRPMCAGVSS